MWMRDYVGVGDWVLVYDGRAQSHHDLDPLTVWNRGGLWWHQLPAPRKRFHRHRAQTRAASTTQMYYTYRCACGATRYSDIPGWTKRER